MGQMSSVSAGAIDILDYIDVARRFKRRGFNQLGFELFSREHPLGAIGPVSFVGYAGYAESDPRANS